MYQPGNFWEYYEKNILSQISKNKLSEFRSWTGAAGKGNIQSFGGGNEILSRNYKRNFHPFDINFSIFDNNPIVRIHNKIINFLIPYVPILKWLILRGPEGRKYFFNLVYQIQVNQYKLIHAMDSELLKISDSEFGKPDGFKINNKFYTLQFLKNLEIIYFLKKNTNFDEINSVIELGAGIVLLASCFLKMKKNVKYIIIDIPPTIFFSEYYLKNLNYKVFGYRNIKNLTKINITEIFKNYDVICIPSWKIDLLSDYKLDIFINIHSFQEMELDQSINYLNKIEKNISRYIYLKNEISGHFKAKRKNKHGVLNPTSKEDIEKIIFDKFKIISSQTHDNNKIYESIYKRF